MKRLIARLDTKGSRLIKGISFEGLRVLGITSDFMEKYSQLAIDEIHLIDSVATLYQRSSLIETIKSSCHNIRTPIIVGGGIKTLEDASSLFNAGADRISLNSALFQSTSIVNNIANNYGAQSIVVSVQAKRNASMPSGWECLCDYGREVTSKDLRDWVSFISTLPIGEISLTSVDNDGRLKGFDHDLLKIFPPDFAIPLTVGGGVSSLNEVNMLFADQNVSGVSVASALHFNHIKLSNPSFSCANFIENSSDADLSASDRSVHILDYNMCNKASIESALRELGFFPVWTNDFEDILSSTRLVMPGVGSFRQAMLNLHELKLVHVLKKRLLMSATNPDIKTVCICLGMQLLFDSSIEGGFTHGLGLFSGTVDKFPDHVGIDKSTHIGWSSIFNTSSDLLANQYFVHSYYCNPIADECVLFKSNFSGFPFVSGVKRNGLIGIQFHPEKSGLSGLELLRQCLI